MKNGNIVNLLIVGVLGYVVYKLSKGFTAVTDTFTGGQSGKDARNEYDKQQSIPAKLNAWKPDFVVNKLQNRKGSETIMLITTQAKKDITADILNAGKWGIYGRLFGQSAEKTLNKIFHDKIKFKSQLSDLAYYFKKATGKDLLYTVKFKLNEAQGILSNTEESNDTLLSLINFSNQLP